MSDKKSCGEKSGKKKGKYECKKCGKKADKENHLCKPGKK